LQIEARIRKEIGIEPSGLEARAGEEQILLRTSAPSIVLASRSNSRCFQPKPRRGISGHRKRRQTVLTRDLDLEMAKRNYR